MKVLDYGRYRVRYAHYDENVYVIGNTNDLTHAHQMAEDFEAHRRARCQAPLPVMIWDSEDYERGDVRGCDEEDQ